MNSSKGAAIEYFLWTRESAQNDKLIYYDKSGKQYEKIVPHQQLEAALKVFDGKRRAIRRSSGGLSIAEPFQLVIYDKAADQKNIRLGVRVRFTDLKRGENDLVESKEIIVHTKVVGLSELKPQFLITKEQATPFLIECGKGLIPVRVHHTVIEGEGQVRAYFSVENELELIASMQKDSTYSLNTYSAPAEILRACDTTTIENQPELRVARDNAQWRLQTGELLIPDCLRHESPLPIPTGTAVETVLQLLRISLSPEDRPFLEPLMINIQGGETGTLIPFGIFER
jgi:hypothetical protein